MIKSRDGRQLAKVITIPATDLKRIIKQLSTINSANTCLGDGKLSVTDGDAGVVVRSGLFENEKVVVVNSRLFQSTVNRLTKDVMLSQDGGVLTIKAGKFTGKIPLLNESIPVIPTSNDKGSKISGTVLSDMISFASTVTDEKASYDHTGAVRLRGTLTGSEAIATDNLRIAFASSLSELNLDIMIPSKVTKAIKVLDGEVTISQTEAAIFFEAGNTTVYTRKLTKPFPDIERVVPKTYKLVVNVSSQELQDSLQRLSPSVDPDNPKIIMDFRGDVLHLSTPQAKDEIPIEPVIPDLLDEPYHLTLGGNWKFLTFYLTTVPKASTIQIMANDNLKPFMLESGSKKLLVAGMRI